MSHCPVSSHCWIPATMFCSLSCVSLSASKMYSTIYISLCGRKRLFEYGVLNNTNNFELAILLVVLCICMVFKNAHCQLFSVYDLYVISTMVFIDLRNSARNSSAGNWLSGTFSAKEERFLSISPLFSVFISTLYPKDVHPFVQPGHHQMFAAAWSEHLFCFRIQSIVFSKSKF